ncbi:hypothetical protein MC885_007403 [Smutsia gigantea]|nr:hypothetical protein MC885_007403 [Smutsia gigantea]
MAPVSAGWPLSPGSTWSPGNDGPTPSVSKSRRSRRIWAGGLAASAGDHAGAPFSKGPLAGPSRSGKGVVSAVGR